MDTTQVLGLLQNKEKNVGEEERAISALVGGVMLAQALFGKKNPLKIAAGGYMLYRGLSGHCPAYSALEKLKNTEPQNITIRTTLTVDKPVEEVYAFWRQLENLPLFMKHLHSVEVTGEVTSTWRANVPGGFGVIEWESTIVLDHENERIGWRSDAGALIENAGTVRFKEVGKSQTELEVLISYHAPAGKIGEMVGRLLNPVFERMVMEDVTNFKYFIETGEIPALETPSSATESFVQRLLS